MPSWQAQQNTKLNPDATPFTPKPKTTTHTYSTITTKAQIHAYPKLDWDTHYTRSEIDQGHLKHVLKPKTPKNTEISTPTTIASETINMPPVKPDCESTSLIGHVKNKKQVHWHHNLAQIHYTTPTYQPTKRLQPTPPRESLTLRYTMERSEKTGRSKLWRDQIVDIVTTLHLQESYNNGTKPKCLSPREMFQQKPVRECPALSSKPLKTNLRFTSSKRITILQRPKDLPRGFSPPKIKNLTPTQPEDPINPWRFLYKSLPIAERLKAYDLVRAWIFNKEGPKSTSPSQFQPP